MISRRVFTMTGGASLFGLPPNTQAQPAGKASVIGVLSGRLPKNDPCLDSLRKGFGELGYIEGRTHVLELRSSEAASESSFSSLASDLIRRKVDVIVAFTNVATLAAKRTTSTIPIVMATGTYPVELGIVASLSHPGGNVTGLAEFTSGVFAKRLQLLKEAVPAIARVSVLRQPGAVNDLMVKDIEHAAQQLGIHLDVTTIRSAEDLAGAFSMAAARHAQGVLTTQGPLFAINRTDIAQQALKHRLPSVSGEVGAAQLGTLMFYGPSTWESCNRTATYVDRILKGAKPADLPMEQPTKFELVINLKTAKALGLTIPPSLLLRADQVIE
jgi:putative tryptophan/tyrosine transport system substrate-binding protein